MMRSLVLVGFFTGVKFEVTSGFDRKWTPKVVPVERNMVEEGISGFKVWWMMRSFGFGVVFFVRSILGLLPVLTGNGPQT